MAEMKEWFAGEPVLGRPVSGPPMTDETDHFYTCPRCGQPVDMRDLAQVSWHEQAEHERLPNEIVYRVANATGMLEEAMRTKPRYEKRPSGDGTWKIVEAESGWVVTMDGLPLDDMEESEADEAVGLLDAGGMTPDTPQAPPKDW